MLDGLKDSKKAVGVKQTLKAVESGTAETVLIAKDADERVIGVLRELCMSNAIDIVYVENMKLLGKACSIEVGAATVAILK